MKISKKLPLLYISALLVMFSCTSQKELTYLNNLDTASVSQFYPMERPEYRIQYQDILYVNVFTINEQLNTQLNPVSRLSSSMMFRDASSTYIYGYTVSDSGDITLPILGDIKVYGKTISEIKFAIEERAKQYLKDANVNVKLLSFKFTVIGEVANPGTYINYNNQLTVLDAIGMGGDITEYGDRKRVLVLRATENGTQTFRINLQDKMLLQSQGYFLLPNDIVIVEPIKSKPFQVNLPVTTLLITTSLSTISTLILLINFINAN